MQTIRSTQTKTGRLRVTVEINADERLMAVSPDAYYRLNEPIDDMVVQGYHIVDAERTCWCVVEQKWVR